jgi:hypothetical protein
MLDNLYQCVTYCFGMLSESCIYGQILVRRQQPCVAKSWSLVKAVAGQRWQCQTGLRCDETLLTVTDVNRQ